MDTKFISELNMKDPADREQMTRYVFGQNYRKDAKGNPIEESAMTPEYAKKHPDRALAHCRAIEKYGPNGDGSDMDAAKEIAASDRARLGNTAIDQCLDSGANVVLLPTTPAVLFDRLLEVQAKAFDPFFTTKEAGHGTGLGLAMALEFAEQSGGALRIESAPGAGTTVRIWMPCAEEVGDTQPVRPEAVWSARLLVDDDPLAEVLRERIDRPDQGRRDRQQSKPRGRKNEHGLILPLRAVVTIAAPRARDTPPHARLDAGGRCFLWGQRA